MMSGDLSEEEDDFEMTKGGRFDEETVEPEVIIRLPCGSDPAPELVPGATLMDPGAVSAEVDTPDPASLSRAPEQGQTEAAHV